MKRLFVLFIISSVAFLLILVNISLPIVDTEVEAQTGAVYTAQSGKIYKGGSEIKLNGANWFGSETDTYVQHGLWTRGYKEMITQMKQNGINAVRVPFCPDTLKDTQNINSYVDPNKNPDLQGLKSLQIFDKIIAELNSQQMYILLDHHRPAGCASITELWYTGSYTEAQWIDDLKFVASRYKSYEYFMGLELKNEPHGSATWGTGNNTDWKVAAEKAGQAVLGINSNILIFVEGVQNNPSCSDGGNPHWWGGNLEPADCYPIDTAKIPKNKLVYSPHVYGPDVYSQAYFGASNFPNNMPGIWDKHFGYLVDDGFTIIPTEWGGKYGNGGDAKDKTWQDALVSYFKTKGICSSFYWSWNPNSGDTGGILQDDWSTVWTNKKNMLNGYWGSCDTSVIPNGGGGSECKADYNDNGIVDISDFGEFGSRYKVNGIDCKYDLAGDDCYLSSLDFGEFGSVFKVEGCGLT